MNEVETIKKAGQSVIEKVVVIPKDDDLIINSEI
ncbi:MAG: hypothetical protein UV30_C0016G0010 [Candidatus Collierbacteria bacterium GW2011_GWF1_42_50]|nr:MAG: hypothetical protein UV30_C0016G0010 [Candidatus Collierbacteria bacterium GW2011_GWF1_42_50]